MAAPVLYVSGNGPPAWSPDEMTKLKEYVEAGGFVLVEAADGNASFDRAFRQKLAQMWPEDKLEPLPKDHPVYSSYFDIPFPDRPRLEAIGGPCWTSLVYVPGGVSCPLDVAAFEDVSFKVCMNIIAYVTGLRKLEGKLVTPQYYVPPEGETVARRGAFTMGQLVHGTEWRPHKVAWPKMLAKLSDSASLDVYGQPLPIRLGADNPFDAQMLYITGVRDVQLSPEDIAALRLYVERGGFIFAEAACGNRQFDQSFRELARQLFPDHELLPLPVGHPLLSMGEPLTEVEYSPGALATSPGLRRPVLEHVEVEGRTVLVYSKYDLSSAIDGHPCYQCPSILEPSAGRLALKVILYGLSM
jgi:hypothetical protein